MAFNVRLKSGQNPLAATGIAGASGTVATGNTISLANVTPGTLSALVTITVETSTLTLIPSFQVSNDGSTWYSVQGSNGTTRTGSGTPATTSEVLALKDSVMWRYARVVATVGVTTAVNTKEFLACSYTYLAPGFT